jgi:hypothetical protein
MVDEFKKGDYIVTLEGNFGGNCAKENYCFKQRINNKFIHPEVDLSGNTNNGHGIMTFDKSKSLTNWRYATNKEILAYNKVNQPINVLEIDQELIIEIW